jgi:uncharacterized damage-inducible protein DinB
MNKQITEILRFIEQERQKLIAGVENLSQTQFDFRPTDETWSVGEILDHLYLSESGVAKIIKMNVSRAAKSNAAPESAASDWGTSLDQYKIENVTRKLKAMEQIVPRSRLAKNEILASLSRSRAELVEAAQAAADYDFAQMDFPHPLLGALNLYQWVRFIGKHELRHLNQIEAVKLDANFPARTSANHSAAPLPIPKGV